jgi:hypothetical protein
MQSTVTEARVAGPAAARPSVWRRARDSGVPVFVVLLLVAWAVISRFTPSYVLPGIPAVARQVPAIVDGEHCTPSPFTTLGQKGAGEAGYMGAPAAVASAVNDALAGRGAGPVLSLPIRPADVWLAIRRSAGPA